MFNKKSFLLSISIALLSLYSSLYSYSQELETSVPFTSKTQGYDTYRIPSIIEANNGTLIAFAEGRRNHSGDAGNIDLVSRRSFDSGQTWETMKILWDDDENTCGNPCPVIDSEGTIHLLLTWNRGDDHESQIIAQTSKDTRKVFVMSSSDHGETWTNPIDITETTKQKNWTWYATGPGAGIRIQNGKFSGRLVIPCDHVESDSKAMHSHIVYSDDCGNTWQIGGVSPKPQTNECEVAELSDGSLQLNMRNYDRSIPARQICYSNDYGITWTDQRHDRTLIEPICQASFRRVETDKTKEIKYLFSNPASERNRERMTIRMSEDNAKTWKYSRAFDDRPAAYSCLVVLKDGTFGCLYETGNNNPYETIIFARFDELWLQENSDSHIE